MTSPTEAPPHLQPVGGSRLAPSIRRTMVAKDVLWPSQILHSVENTRPASDGRASAGPFSGWVRYHLVERHGRQQAPPWGHDAVDKWKRACLMKADPSRRLTEPLKASL